MRWPSEPEKFKSGFLQNKPARALNLAGVDVDNYFTESKMDSLSTSTEGQFALNKREDSTESNMLGHENPSLFENVRPYETVSRSKEDESGGDPFSAWEVDFQSADSGIQHQEPKFSDPFVDSSSVDLSSQMDAVFGPGNTLLNGKTKENVTFASNMNDSFDGDIWSNTNAGPAVLNDQIEVSIDNKAHRAGGNSDISSSENVSWIQGDEFPTSFSSNKTTDNRTIDKDIWNDFTSSSNVQVPCSNSSEDDVDFGQFSQPDFFSSTCSDQNGPPEMNIMPPHSYVSDRAGSAN